VSALADERGVGAEPGLFGGGLTDLANLDQDDLGASGRQDQDIGRHTALF
jgi:hypothetical protein